jgi:hypothetical protein
MDNIGFGKNNNTQKKSFIGFVADYTLDDGSKGIALLSDDGDEFFVIPNEKYKRLKGYIDEEIVVTGIVTTDDTGKAYISIRGFEPLEDNDDEFADGYDEFEFEFGYDRDSY